MGLPGLRGLEGAPGKGIPGEKVIFNQCQLSPKYYISSLVEEGCRTQSMKGPELARASQQGPSSHSDVRGH